MSTIEPTLRDLRRRRARSEIAATAIALFQEHGYDATTVDQIATAALVSPRTFYNYFSSKDDVLFDEVDAGLDAFRAQVAADAATAGPFEAVRRACVAVADHLDAHAESERPRLALIASVATLRARDHRTDQALVDAIEAALTGHDDADPAVPEHRRARAVAAATIAGLNEATSWWTDGDVDRTLAALVEELLDTLRPLYPQ